MPKPADLSKISNCVETRKKYILGLGHPRTGTRFTSKILKKWGLDVDHERFGDDGIVAWQLIKEQGPYPYTIQVGCRPNFDFLIYNVRNPYYSIPSIVYTEDNKEKSFDYRKKILGLSDSDNPIENAILSLCLYDLKVVEMNPDVTFRVEDEQLKLFESLSKNGISAKFSVHDKKENTRKHKNFDEMIEQFAEVSEDVKKLINKFSEKYGYEKVF